MGEIHSHFDLSIFFIWGWLQPPTSSACDFFGRLELIENPVLSIIFLGPTLEAKDALKEATKEAAKKRKKEMQTATEDGISCKTTSWLQVLNERSESSNLIEFDLLLDFSDLQAPFGKAEAPASKKRKEAGHAAKENHAYWKQRMKTSMTSKYATQILLGFAKDEIDMSYQPTWRRWNFAAAMTLWFMSLNDISCFFSCHKRKSCWILNGT